MAYRDPQSLTCPTCGLTGRVMWIVGTGPQTKPGEGPAYVRLMDAGPFTAETEGSTTRILCPQDGTLLTTKGAAT